MSGSKVDLREVANAVLRSCSPFGRDEQALVRAAYHTLARGSPVTIDRLADAAGLAGDVVASTLSRLTGLARLDDAGRVVEFLGLSLRPTPHRFEVGGRALYSWCAWDSLFIPRVLGTTARVVSPCPVTGETIRLVVGPDGIADVAPRATWVSFLLACGSEGAAGVVRACCRHVHFLSSPAAAVRWLAGQPGGFVLDLADAWELGRLFVDDGLSGSAPPRDADDSVARAGV